MSTVFYHRPRKSFYARAHIPLSIRQHFAGRVDCWRSLGTKDKPLAKAKAAVWNGRLQTLFYTLDRKGAMMNQAQVDGLIQHYLYATLDDCESYRREHIGSMTDDQVESQMDGCATALEDLWLDLMNGNYAGQKSDVDELLTTAKLPLLDPTSPAYALLARELIKAKQRVYEEEQRRWQGDYSKSAAAAVVAQVGSAPAAPAVPTKLFSEVARLYLKEHHTRQARTQGMIESAFKSFLDVIGGDKPLGEITKADCRAFKDSMVLARRKAATVNKHLHSLDHLFRWAKGQGFVADGHVSPVSGLRIAKSVQKKEALKRTVFTSEELQRLVQHPAFQREKTRHPERYWIVMLCLYAGLRREEAAQLLVSQVVHDGASGVWYFDITDQGENQSLKNQASQRRVPLHTDLISRLGFLDYVAGVNETSHARLFYQCKASANGYGDATGKWFGRLLHHTLKFPPTLVLHSLRHGFITGLHAAGVADQLVFALCGHTGAGGEVHATYTHRGAFRLTVLSEAVDKLDFGLD